MPIYEYQCEKCSHEFEREQRITDDPVKTCPKCKARRVKKLISQTSFVLKGGGWYSDLYSSTKPEDKKDKYKGESSSDSDAGKDSKTESKSEKKDKAGKSEKSEKSEKSSKGSSKKDAA
jgi:putative FmdB family regulatory protein